MRKLIFGSKSERFVETANNTEQLNLFNTDTLSEKPEQAITETVSYQRKKKQGAQKAYRPLTFPNHLEIEIQIKEPDVDTSDMKKIGEEVSEYLDYTEASLKRIRIVRRPK